ncbi:helix-turn-helix transcriptional regulator [Arthrobacter gengyunqii]|uniref:Helix-turn-helix transcriptional regulator n=1 Tax=Arthrobacter gengyunqii TaxID=2886940 RepID=A0A9X1LZ58_9MICC|nr:helix-turn-helix transcriptional regulator [Arthrobacter gengyunqii]MCC3265576.1 helix-turn-helix transcriptional regulator [Arthrobacter gengyunqii]MCC3268314.1 helix-turn-helix transcriptional regulator [Arthrobacter gengyunqii]UOY95717.1 helix-turn-helix transcriptional regulator [Arthrobacter gengyunqii]
MENALPQRRQEIGWSQERLADELGVSRQTIISIEKGRYDPSLPLAFRLAEVFHCRIEDLFTPDA